MEVVLVGRALSLQVDDVDVLMERLENVNQNPRSSRLDIDIFEIPTILVKAVVELELAREESPIGPQ